MNTEPNEVQAAPVVKVARDLTAIVDLYTRLHAEAEHKANDPLMPGGLAMVSLANVANLEAWEHRYESSETFGRPADHVFDEDDTWEPPLQTLCFWSEAWRNEHGAEYDQRPTLATEANFIRWALPWAWDSELHWDDFARDIANARRRLENLLHEGQRAERGAPCLYETCGGVRLVRKLVPGRDDEGHKVWRLSDWHCPRCKRSWDEKRYASMVTAAHEAAKVEEIEGVVWCTIDHAARVLQMSPKTIRTWITRRHVSEVCVIQGRRRFVSLEEVRDRREEGARNRTTAV